MYKEERKKNQMEILTWLIGVNQVVENNKRAFKIQGASLIYSHLAFYPKSFIHIQHTLNVI